MVYVKVSPFLFSFVFSFPVDVPCFLYKTLELKAFLNDFLFFVDLFLCFFGGDMCVCIAPPFFSCSLRFLCSYNNVSVALLFKHDLSNFHKDKDRIICDP